MVAMVRIFGIAGTEIQYGTMTCVLSMTAMQDSYSGVAAWIEWKRGVNEAGSRYKPDGSRLQHGASEQTKRYCKRLKML